MLLADNEILSEAMINIWTGNVGHATKLKLYGNNTLVASRAK